jgi:hypothetical protein
LRFVVTPPNTATAATALLSIVVRFTEKVPTKSTTARYVFSLKNPTVYIHGVLMLYETFSDTRASMKEAYYNNLY